jgi:predicted translin family RNA/ssDNA-binding protein
MEHIYRNMIKLNPKTMKTLLKSRIMNSSSTIENTNTKIILSAYELMNIQGGSTNIINPPFLK